MCPAERVAVIQEKAPVGEVEGSDGDRPAFSERLSERKICRGAGRQMVWTVAVYESRAIEHGDRRPRVPGQRDAEYAAQRGALVMVEKEIATVRR